MYLNSTKDILLSQFWTFSEYFFSAGRFSKLAGNGSGLGDGGQIEAELSTKIQILTEAQNLNF